MSHSKRNTSLAFFTSHERSLLKSEYGTLRTRLTRDSFRALDSCNLCLNRAVAPVSCSSGDLFCRECAVGNLVAQRGEIERLNRERERRAMEEEEERAREEERRKEEEVREFEMVMAGLEGRKRKREGDAVDGEGAKKRAVEDESKPKSSFWVPSETPSATTALPPPKLQPSCPASDPANPHVFSLKDLITVHFEESSSETTKDGQPLRVCPACSKALTNATRAMICAPCGHVVCKPCAEKFIVGEDAGNPGKKKKKRCYVCEESLEEKKKDKEKEEKEGKKKKKRGLVEIRGDGTGFAAGGAKGGVVEKRGTAFLV